MIWNIIFDILGSFFQKLRRHRRREARRPQGPLYIIHLYTVRPRYIFLAPCFSRFLFGFLSTKSERARLKIGISYLIFLVLFPKVDGGVNILGKCAFKMFAKRIDHGGICFFIQRHSNNLRQPD